MRNRNLIVNCFGLPAGKFIMLKFIGCFFITCLAGHMIATAQSQKHYLSVPGREEYTHISPEGVTVLPSGRWLTPAGHTIRIAHDPFGMAVSPDGTDEEDQRSQFRHPLP